jgi:hypothetical protein
MIRATIQWWVVGRGKSRAAAAVERPYLSSTGLPVTRRIAGGVVSVKVMLVAAKGRAGCYSLHALDYLGWTRALMPTVISMRRFMPNS